MQRTFKGHFSHCEIATLLRNEPLVDKLDIINQSSALITAGGPVYSSNMYPDQIPLVPDLNDIKCKIVPIGLGWYGSDLFNETTYSYGFTEKMIKLLERMSHDSSLSCRDVHTANVLKNNGFNNVLITGCPAWYELSTVNSLSLRSGLNYPYKKICVSDPARIEHHDCCFNIVSLLRKRYPDADITFIFHRGIVADNMTNEVQAASNIKLHERLQEIDVKVRDISYSHEGFGIYNDCDIHIGYRVHAHLYNLSIRNPSILVEEDARGGVNETLGLPSIKAYGEHKLTPKLISNTNDLARKFVYSYYKFGDNNMHVLNNLSDILDLHESENFLRYENVFRLQQHYYEIMKSHILSISSN